MIKYTHFTVILLYYTLPDGCYVLEAAKMICLMIKNFNKAKNESIIEFYG